MRSKFLTVTVHGQDDGVAWDFEFTGVVYFESRAEGLYIEWYDAVAPSMRRTVEQHSSLRFGPNGDTLCLPFDRFEVTR